MLALHQQIELDEANLMQEAQEKKNKARFHRDCMGIWTPVYFEQKIADADKEVTLHESQLKKAKEARRILLDKQDFCSEHVDEFHASVGYPTYFWQMGRRKLPWIPWYGLGPYDSKAHDARKERIKQKRSEFEELLKSQPHVSLSRALERRKKEFQRRPAEEDRNPAESVLVGEDERRPNVIPPSHAPALESHGYQQSIPTPLLHRRPLSYQRFQTNRWSRRVPHRVPGDVGSDAAFHGKRSQESHHALPP